jgi:hypothetical protein
VPEFDDVAARGVKLTDDVLEAGFCIAIARRKPEEKTSHAVTEYVGDHPKIPHERPGAFELLDVCDEFTDLAGVDERFPAGLTAPGLNARYSRP